MATPSLIHKAKKRIIYIMVAVFFFFFVVACALVNITLIKGDQYKKEAIEQQTRDRLITPPRGTIYDRNMKPLAVSASVETVSITPKIVR